MEICTSEFWNLNQYIRLTYRSRRLLTLRKQVTEWWKYLCIYYDNVSTVHSVKRDIFKERTVSTELELNNLPQRVTIHKPYSTDSLHTKIFCNLNIEDRHDNMMLQLNLSNLLNDQQILQIQIPVTRFRLKSNSQCTKTKQNRVSPGATAAKNWKCLTSRII
jgi:hypothetical protein